MDNEIERWLETEGLDFIKKVGIKSGQTALDFGAKNGSYTIPVAKIIGREAVVYALDKNPDSLDELMEKAQGENLENIERIDISNGLKIPLKKGSLDVILLYDVVHLVGENNRSNVSDRKKLYQAVYEVAKKGALISVYPTHLTTHTDVISNKEIKKEIEESGFSFEKEINTELVHDEEIVRGCILNFRKI